MRHELTDFERAAIKPFLPNKPDTMRTASGSLPASEAAWANIPLKRSRKDPI
jgi:hypothetical protein